MDEDDPIRDIYLRVAAGELDEEEGKELLERELKRLAEERLAEERRGERSSKR